MRWGEPLKGTRLRELPRRRAFSHQIRPDDRNLREDEVDPAAQREDDGRPERDGDRAGQEQRRPAVMRRELDEEDVHEVYAERRLRDEDDEARALRPDADEHRVEPRRLERDADAHAAEEVEVRRLAAEQERHGERDEKAGGEEHGAYPPLERVALEEVSEQRVAH